MKESVYDERKRLRRGGNPSLFFLPQNNKFSKMKKSSFIFKILKVIFFKMLKKIPEKYLKQRQLN